LEIASRRSGLREGPKPEGGEFFPPFCFLA
jgi:hypothetical protein